MPEKHDQLKAAAIAAVDALHGDTSVSQQVTLDDLEEIASHIDLMASSLREEIAREED